MSPAGRPQIGVVSGAFVLWSCIRAVRTVAEEVDGGRRQGGSGSGAAKDDGQSEDAGAVAPFGFGLAADEFRRMPNRSASLPLSSVFSFIYKLSSHRVTNVTRRIGFFSAVTALYRSPSPLSAQPAC